MAIAVLVWSQLSLFGFNCTLPTIFGLQVLQISKRNVIFQIIPC